MTRAKQITKEAKKFAKEIDDWEIAEDVQDAFEQGAKWADAHPHWISVEEQLPPKEAREDEFITDMSIDVLATDGKTIHMCFYDHNLERWLYGDFWQLDNITHWMPMPEVPHHIIDVNKKVDRVIGTADHIKAALDVLNKKGDEK